MTHATNLNGRPDGLPMEMTMRLGRDTGSLVNHVMGAASPALPAVGDGATLLGWTDRSAGTVIKVTRCTVTVREDHAVRTDDRGACERQDYTFSPNPDGRIYVFRLTKLGWRAHGKCVRFGVRHAYHDYSF